MTGIEGTEKTVFLDGPLLRTGSRGGSAMEMEVKRRVKVHGKSELGTGMVKLRRGLHLRPCRGQE